MAFKFDFLPEPKLRFMRGDAYNPTVGLIKFGPRFASIDEKQHKWLKIGIIGSGPSVSLVYSLLDEMKHVVSPKKPTKWNLPFPGLNLQSSLMFSLSYPPELQQKIVESEISQISKIPDRKQRTAKFAELIDQKMQVLYDKSPPPDCVIVSLPSEIETACKETGTDETVLKLPDNSDFHNWLKLCGMKYKIPTQLITNDTLTFSGTQEKNIVYWNLAVGFLYKSQKGYPWKLASLENNTCYVGISFFHEKTGEDITTRASTAQVFLDTGESFILRGDAFKWTNRKYPKSPHMSEEDATNLIARVIGQYKIVRGTSPARIVIHKSSNFWPEEKEGFLKVPGNATKKDLITIHPTGVKFYRPGDFGVIRGSLISNLPDKRSYLFTTGMVPCINTYPGLGLPTPLAIEHDCLDSDLRTVCDEILSFTKLDWNNAFLYRKDPVTLSVSRRVGDILSEPSIEGLSELDPHYYYYM